MSYFSKFPLYLTTAGYRGPIGSDSQTQNQVIITDFFRRIRTGAGFSEISTGIIPYAIQDGYTPERLAHEFYGSAFYHWVILLVNNIVNPREEWPMDGDQFNEFMSDNYEDVTGIHHYIDPESGFVVDSDFAGATPVTNLEYEEEINEQKRHIKMLDSKYLQQFVTMFDNQIAK